MRHLGAKWAATGEADLMKKQPKSQHLVAAVSRMLPEFRRYRGGEQPGTLCFVNEAEARLIAFDLTSRKDAVFLTFVTYENRALPSASDLWEFESTYARALLGPVSTLDDSIEDWLQHYSCAWESLDPGDPFLSAFRDSRTPTDAEVSEARETIWERFALALGLLRGDIPCSELCCPLGTFSVVEMMGSVGQFGEIPAYRKLAFDPMRKGRASDDWMPLGVELSQGLSLSNAQTTQLVETEFSVVEELLSSGKDWRLDTRFGHVVVFGGERSFDIEVPIEFVLHLNRSSAQYCELIRSLGARWRAAYDQIESVDDPLEVLEQAVRIEPLDMKRWRQLSKFLIEAGDVAGGHLALARGYLAKNSLGIAKGKLELAMGANPDHQGIAEVASSLHRALERKL